MSYNVELIIIGAGASGLMAAVTAGQLGLPCLLLERRHRPGLKLLLCGNNRCNISHVGGAVELVREYGGSVGNFLRPAIEAFPPARLRQWFRQSGVPTIVNRDRIYPRSENADDVLHCFTDQLRDLGVPMALNCPVSAITQLPQGGFQVRCEKVSFSARRVLLATGGASYPKTGSVGDGYRLAGALGHSIQPCRASLAGMDSSSQWLPQGNNSASLTTVRVTVREPGHDNVLGVTEGNLLYEGQVLRGSAIFDASRLIARSEPASFILHLDLLPDLSLPALQDELGNAANSQTNLSRCLVRLGIEQAFAASVSKWLFSRHPARDWGALLKAMILAEPRIRPLKEAIVTRGGVSLAEINPDTMESKICPGLYFAGELIDIDGPTGGFNLHAAFATAQLAIEQISGKSRPVSSPGAQTNQDRRRTAPRQSPRATQTTDRRHRPTAPPRRRPASNQEPQNNNDKTEFWRQRQPRGKGRKTGRGNAKA